MLSLLGCHLAGVVIGLQRNRDVVRFGHGHQTHIDRLDDRLRGDTIRLIVFRLDLAPAIGLSDSTAHAVGHDIGVEDRAAVEVPRSPADGLNERPRRPQEAFFIGIENRDQRDLGQIETFPKEVHANQGVILATAEVAQDSDAVECADLGMQIGAAHADLGVIFGQILGHALGQRGNQHTLVNFSALADLYLWIDQASGPDNLLNHYTRGFREFVRAGCSRHVNGLVHAILKLFESERPIVQSARHAETEGYQRFLTGAVTVVHAPQLRDRLVALIDEQQGVMREIIEQRRRRLSGQAAGKVARVVLNAMAVADLPYHLEIEHGALIQALSLDNLALLFELLVPPFEFQLDAAHGPLSHFGRHDVVRFRINGQAQVSLSNLAEQRIDLAQRFYFVAPQFDAVGVIVVGRKDFDNIAANAETAALEIAVVALIKDFDQALYNLVARNLLALFEHQQHAVIGFG